jgi:hypothetical protein
MSKDKKPSVPTPAPKDPQGQRGVIREGKMNENSLPTFQNPPPPPPPKKKD